RSVNQIDTTKPQRNITMELRQLGRSSLRVAPLALGTNVMGWNIDEAASFKILDAFIAEGFNLIDTADVYSNWKPGNSGGESETIIGNWMKARGTRSKVIVATKVGHELSPEKKGLRKEYILRAVEDSLRRLQTDYIDLYQSHKDDLATPQEESLGAYAKLVKEGKVRVIGASNFSAERLSSALALSAKNSCPRYESFQPCYNLYDRGDFEGGPMAVCQSEEIGVIPYFSLGAGFLTGKYKSVEDLEGRARAGRVKKYFDERGINILKALDHVAAETKSKPGQVAIAWLLSRPTIAAPIASATDTAQLKEILDGTRLKLSPEQAKLLDI
ncbi:MAG: aldo/keto reductase, partial [Candidatus Zixiibacteriota bacterium]